MVDVLFQPLEPSAQVPSYAHGGDAGADLCAVHAVTLKPGERALVGTGLSIAIPDGYVGLIHPRSGLALRHGLSIVNSPGTIDAGYRGEIKVLLINLDPSEDIVIAPGDRIAQLLVQAVERVQFVQSDSLASSERGAGGYGSSGGHASLNSSTATRDEASDA